LSPQPLREECGPALSVAGLVQGERRGKWVWYSLNRDRLAQLRSAIDNWAGTQPRTMPGRCGSSASTGIPPTPPNVLLEEEKFPTLAERLGKTRLGGAPLARTTTAWVWTVHRAGLPRRSARHDRPSAPEDVRPWSR